MLTTPAVNIIYYSTNWPNNCQFTFSDNSIQKKGCSTFGPAGANVVSPEGGTLCGVSITVRARKKRKKTHQRRESDDGVNEVKRVSFAHLLAFLINKYFTKTNRTKSFPSSAAWTVYSNQIAGKLAIQGGEIGLAASCGRNSSMERRVFSIKPTLV